MTIDEIKELIVWSTRPVLRNWKSNEAIIGSGSQSAARHPRINHHADYGSGPAAKSPPRSGVRTSAKAFKQLEELHSTMSELMW